MMRSSAPHTRGSLSLYQTRGPVIILPHQSWPDFFHVKQPVPALAPVTGERMSRIHHGKGTRQKPARSV